MNDKPFEDMAGKVIVAAFVAVFLLMPAVGIAYGIGAELNKPTGPTYHCDGPGYADPGTPEARACWIEESE